MRHDFKTALVISRRIILLVIISSGMNCSSGRVPKVRIDNLGNTTLKSVVVHVKGSSYDVGDIDANESKSVMVKPNGESSLEVEFGNETGEKKRLKTDFNLEPDYSGFILVRIKNDSIAHAEKDY